MRILGGWMVGGALLLGAFGCNGPTASGPVVAQERHVQAPPRPLRRVFANPLALGAAVHAPPTTVAAPLAGAVVDARALVITADGTDAAFMAISRTLEYLGAPFDVLNATTGPTLTADGLASGTHGKYDAIFLDLGGLETMNGSAFTTAEWTALENYEAAFNVRRVALYASPNAMYDLGDNGSIDPQKTPVTLSCTAAGATAFVGTNCTNSIVMTDGWAYPAAVVSTGDTVTPLLSDASGNVYGVTVKYADGREALALTFAQAYYLTPYLELAYGLVNWATRGLFVGERHVYVVPQIDDLFLASTIYTGGPPYRINDADMQSLANWQNGTRGKSEFTDLRLAWCANGQGSQSMPGDPLTAKAIALGPTFSYINHSWDHPILDGLSYADVLSEFTRNDAYIKSLGLMPYATINAVTPSISGLTSADAMLAIHDAGIRQIVSDTSIASEDNPSPNAGMPNALQPSVLEMPRIPTDLFFDVSQPAEWIPEYEALVSAGAAVDYSTVLGNTSDKLVQYMLNGDNDSWMFHQANTRDYDGQGDSLLSDLLTATLNKYAALATFPIVTPTMDDLATRVQNRMTFDASGVTATITPSTSITVSVAQAATVPVTGVCTPAAESYAGQTISYLALGAGQSVTLSLTDCNPGYGTGGATGAGGTTGAGGATATGGATGAGGTTGAGGVGGTGVIVGTGGASGTGGAAGAGGISGTGGAGTAGASGEGATGGSGETEGTGGAGETAGAGGAPPTTGAAGDTGQDAGVAPPAASNTGCDCSTASGPTPETSVLLIGAVGFLLGRRSRRGGRSGRGSSGQRGATIASGRTRRSCCPAGARP